MIDDVKAEGDAFKYSKKNLLDDILYYRYENEARTIITCNYDKNHPNDLEKAIDEFGTKYDGRIYDRLFEMFNIIEVKDLKFIPYIGLNTLFIKSITENTEKNTKYKTLALIKNINYKV